MTRAPVSVRPPRAATGGPAEAEAEADRGDVGEALGDQRGIWLLKSADLGSANRARVMRLLYAAGPLTRADLATRLQVSRATIGTIVQPLLDQGVLFEQPARAPGEAGGKPARPLWFSPDVTVGSIYLTAQECTVAAVALEGKLVTSRQCTLPSADPDDTLALIVGLAQEVLGDATLPGIGVAFAGMVDTTTGSLLANYRRPSVSLLPLNEALTRAFHVPVYVDHHPRIQAFGDSWFGPGRQLDHFASVVTGEVLGVGFVHGGEVLRGPRGAGGEAGHMIVDRGGARCTCGRRGCWETIATLSWLRREAQALGLPDPQAVTCARLAAAAESGGSLEAELMRRYASSVALGLANLEQLVGSTTYVLHGDVTDGGETMRELLQAELVDNAPRREPSPRVLFASAPDDSTLLGAAGLVLSNLYQPTLGRRRAAKRRMSACTTT